MFPLTVLLAILTVLSTVSSASLQCNSNIGSEGLIVGENDCYNLEREPLRTTCWVTDAGDLSEPPELEWRWKTPDGSTVRVRSQVAKRGPSGDYTVDDEFNNVPSSMNGVLIECKVKNMPNVEPCRLARLSVQYVKRFQPTPLHIHHRKDKKENFFKDVTCFVNASKAVSCYYTWNMRINDSLAVQEPAKELPTFVNLVYECIANCRLKNKSCTVRDAKTLILLPTHTDECHQAAKKGVILTSVVLAFIIGPALVILLVCCCCARQCGKLARNLNNLTTDENEEKKKKKEKSAEKDLLKKEPDHQQVEETV